MQRILTLNYMHCGPVIEKVRITNGKIWGTDSMTLPNEPEKQNNVSPEMALTSRMIVPLPKC